MNPEQHLTDAAAAKLGTIRREVDERLLVGSDEMAWEMADAEKPFHEELITRSRSLTPDQVFRLGILAERKGEEARQAFLNGTTGTPNNVQEALLTTPRGNMELSEPVHPVIEQLNANLQDLEYAVESIFTRLRVQGVDQYMATTREPFGDLPSCFVSFEKAAVYDYRSGTLTYIKLITQEAPGKPDFHYSYSVIDRYEPIENAGRSRRLVGKGLSYSRDVRKAQSRYLHDSTGESLYEHFRTDDPLLVSGWLTRLAGAVPVTQDEIAQLYYTGRKKSVTTRRYRGKTITQSSDTRENTIDDSLLNRLKERYQNLMV